MAAFAPGEELVLYATIPLALNAVVKLGAFDEIADSVLSASEIVSRITNNPSANVAFLDRTLRVLATYGVVNETVVQGQRKYGLSEIGKRFSPGTKLAARGLSVMCNHRIFLKPFEHLAEGILDGGEPFRKAHGKTAYELVAEEPEFNNSFNLCMADHSKRSSAVLLDCYKGFASIKTLVDVGGGNGALLCDIRTRYPHIKGINFDQPHVVSQGIASEGVEHAGGDMFGSIPQGDSIMLKWILHNWNDEQCLKILQNCYKSLPAQGGKVIVVEVLLPSEAYQAASEFELRIGLLLDLVMMVNFNGKERTFEEYQALAEQAGFNKVHLVNVSNGLAILEFHK
ncbi:caffeic acid 3-O-methyltransferase [Selaginella moellendorffii]|uniref:caffeic acid 3-O-methyltransferase n=1 Tax=Selaginella moellendorffii TaxID=88036 RepID=UPI000D1CB256|nr:caffeic acid 3-O-methyltransferase [Selaginella moellendorffii]XP_024521688.1 caffeic acid 3-O-methyltransferase [Selaginella moellendorffii]|eukprot:XP_024521686.1 caffeic acid 3-O-methyltransferase [Selaginella moellendorffii]